MDLRVSQQVVVQNAINAMRDIGNQLVNLQVQSATGKKFTQISDDPVAAMTVLANDTQVAQFDTHLENIKTTQATLNMSVSTLQQISGLFSSARSLALEASNSTNDPAAMETLASQVDGMIDQLLGLANTSSNDRFLFSGTASSTPPFIVGQTDAQGRPLVIQYQGTADASSTMVDRRQIVQVNYPGSDIFAVSQRQPTTFKGNTGAKPGAGTDSLTGTATLLVQHTATTFDPGSGVQPGASSALGDTILGPAGTHTLTIVDTSGTGASGTVALDGGRTFAFTSADTNLSVTNGSGDVVYLNMSAIVPNFNGTVNIAASGTISIDGGQTTTPIDYTNAQTAVDGATGKLSFVDTTGITRTGKEAVTYPGTFDAFQSLIALRDALRNTNGLSQADQINSISNHISELDRVRQGVLTALGNQSASLQSLDELTSHLQDLQLSAQTASSDLGSADISELVVKLQSYNQMLQLSMATFTRIMGVSLLDYLG